MNFEILNTVEDGIDFMPFLLKGLEQGNLTQNEDHRMSKERFVKTVMDVLSRDENDRLVVVATKDNKPVGYLVNFRVEIPFLERNIVLCWLAFSEKGEWGVLTGLYNFGVQWAREHGYNEIQCYTARDNGAATRLFEKRLKFKYVTTFYSRMLI